MHNPQKWKMATHLRLKLPVLRIAFGLLFCIGQVPNPVHAQLSTFRGRQVLEETEGDRVIRYVDGLYVIRFHEWVTPAEKRDFFNRHGLEPYFDESPTGRWHVRGIPSSDNHVRIANFLKEPIIAKAILTRIVKIFQGGNKSRSSETESTEGLILRDSYFSPPDDEYYELQWYLNNTGVMDGDSTGATPDADINAPEAWEIEEGEPLFVAVLDSGIPLDGQGNLNHPDLTNEGTTRVIELFEWAVFYDEPNLDDLCGHGTNVTGVLTATKDNDEEGIAGLVTEKIHVVPVKVGGQYEEASPAEMATYVEETIDELEDENPNYRIILNCSWGWNEEDQDGEMLPAVNYAYNHGVLMVCAIGNEQNEAVEYPAVYAETKSNVIAVGSTNWNDEVSSWSSTGDEITVVAPGGGDGDYKVRFQSHRNIYTTFQEADYGWNIGTSFATALVTGLAALVWSIDPDLTPEEVRQAIIDNAVDIGASSNRMGNGRIDAYATLSNVYDPVTAPTGLFGVYFAPGHGGPKVHLEWNRNPSGQGVDKYWLERAVEEGEFITISKTIPDPGSGSTVEYDNWNPPEAEYLRYRVKAHNDYGWGPSCSPVIVELGPFKSSYEESVPTRLKLEPNYPNPSNTFTHIRFGLPQTTNVRLRVMNVRGQTVRVLIDEIIPAGWHTVTWDGKNDAGIDVASGIYLYMIEVDNKKILKKMTIIR